MSTLIYTLIKDDTPLVTFKCDGCGRRFPAQQLYGQKHKAKLLAKGQIDFQGIMLTLTCSVRCSKKAEKITLQEFEAFLAQQFAVDKVQLNRPFVRPKKKTA